MGFLNIKIAARFFREYSKLRVETVTEFADILQQEYQLFDLLFDELKNYMAKVQQSVAKEAEAMKKADKKVEYSKLSEGTYFDLFAHSDQLTERMNFIKDFANVGSFKITM